MVLADRYAVKAIIKARHKKQRHGFIAKDFMCTLKVKLQDGTSDEDLFWHHLAEDDKSVHIVQKLEVEYDSVPENVHLCVRRSKRANAVGEGETIVFSIAPEGSHVHRSDVLEKDNVLFQLQYDHEHSIHFDDFWGPLGH